MVDSVMHEGMTGPHLFEYLIETDSPTTPSLVFQIKGLFEEK